MAVSSVNGGNGGRDIFGTLKYTALEFYLWPMGVSIGARESTVRRPALTRARGLDAMAGGMGGGAIS